LPEACRIVIYRFGPYSCDTESLELSKAGEPVPVQPQVFALLTFLIENRTRVVSKDEIIDTVWQGRAVGDGTLNARINALRRALGDDGATQGVIKTLPRQGFRFVATLDEDTGTAPTHVQTTPTGSASIAVLPFMNISGDQEQLYFADGLTEDLITDLSKIQDLFVIARNSSFAFRNSPQNVSDIGRELGVAFVLEGSVRRAGDRIRINAQLIETRSGGHVWAERYDGTVQDIFDVQDEITEKIISALKVNLTGGLRTGRGTDSVKAYELCLKGRAKFFMFSPETNAECINLLEQAVEIDPDYSNAWSEQVFPHQSGWSFAWKGYDDGLLIAEEKAKRAVELDDHSSLAFSRLGWVQTFLRQPEKAIANFERSLSMDPNNADTHIWFSEALNYAGQPERAEKIGMKSLEFDPFSPPNCLHHIGHAHFLMGNLEKAAEYDLRAIRMAPSFPPARIVMAAIYSEMGQLDQAREQIADLLAIDPGYNFKRYDERYPYYSEDHRRRMREGLLSAGLS
jgi:TolB-like protein/Flp pilus assembly protein TadD